MAVEIVKRQAMGQQWLQRRVRLGWPTLDGWAEQQKGTTATDGATQCPKVIWIKTGMRIQYTGGQGSPEELTALPGGHN